ncbi:MAG: triose-phosphate isomerase [Desulfovibrionaceae bacterium]
MKKLMAANWKMYKTRAEAGDTATSLAKTALPEDREVLVFAPFTTLDRVAAAFAGVKGFAVGGQDVYPAKEGAFTGEISPGMLADAGATWALTGHSERRHVLGEPNSFVGEKTSYCLEQGLNVVLCVGETLEEREEGRLESVMEEQLLIGLSGVAKDVPADRLAVAYEPVWAIGTGKVAGPAEILAAHAFVRARLVEIFPKNGSQIRILYGGSVKPENCAEIIALDNVDGVLVGGASLQAESFGRIVSA